MNDFSEDETLQESRFVPVSAFNEKFDNFGENKQQINEKFQDELSTSLISLTTHFAQVQFRLRQVIIASPDTKDELLQSLEKFASKSISNIEISKEKESGVKVLKEINCIRQEQKKILKDLKTHLVELGNCGFDGKRKSFYQKNLRERYHTIIDQLKFRMNITDEHFDVMAPESICKEINIALDRLVAPLLLKDQFNNELKTQISDLENLVCYLQENNRKPNTTFYQGKPEKAFKILHDFFHILDMFAFTQLGCSFQQTQKSQHIQGEDFKKFLELLDNLKQSVTNIEKLFEKKQRNVKTELEISESNFNTELTKLVRDTLASSLQNLIQHGTYTTSGSNLQSIFGCCLRQRFATNTLHVWDILLKYQAIQYKQVPKFMLTTVLLKSFNLKPILESETSPRKELLWCIKSITLAHEPYKRDVDLQFKAFVCAALNSGSLVLWLNLIFSNKHLVRQCYQSSSYVAKTEFRECLRILGVLTNYKFNLSVNIAVTHLQDIKDVFY